ncbi:MAG: hypothetical protein ACTHN8_00815 [Angustibacter sp.]
MGDTFAFAPVPTAGGLSGKRTLGSAPARGTGAKRSSEGEALGVGDAVLVDADAVLVDGDAVLVVGDGDRELALAVAVVVETDDADDPAPLLQPAANATAATTSAVRASLT